MFLSIQSWKITLLWAIILTSLLTIAFVHQLQQSRHFVFENHEFFFYDVEKEEPLDPHQRCQLPRIHPFDPSILSYLVRAKEIKCKERQLSLTYVDKDGFLKYNLTDVNKSNYKVDELSCDYQEISRSSDDDVSYGPKVVLAVNGSKIHSEFVFVSCYNFAGFAFYTNIHYHVIPQAPPATPSPGPASYYNVLIFGIDSLSRLSFIRHLPKTYSYLTKKLKAHVFRGMTKVGDNTFPNLGAILTGKSVFSDELPRVEKGETYDSWPLLWKNFSRAGYATLYAEDRPEIALFNYLRGGFKDPPTLHYMRPFWLAVESSKRHRTSSVLCFGSVPKHMLQIGYTADFVDKYSKINRPFFGFSFLVELSHDYVSQVSVADRDLEGWLDNLLRSGYLNRTFLFFLSDHGHRFDAMRSTLVGRIEERMPFFSIVPPPSVVNQQHILHNLKSNCGRLTSPYDIYYTALDILEHSLKGSELGTTTSNRGTSLFGPISVNRTCLEAGIPDHYCTCEVEQALDPKDERSQKASTILVQTINNLLETTFGNFSLCHELVLDEVIRSDLIVPNQKVIVNSRVYFGRLVEDGRANSMLAKLRIIIRTSPGEALFEATILHREDDNSMTVLGDISRINKYGTQSWCINDATLRKYCYCVDQNYKTIKL